MSTQDCGCDFRDNGTVLCAEHWDWLMARLDEPPTEAPALAEAARRYGERRK